MTGDKQNKDKSKKPARRRQQEEELRVMAHAIESAAAGIGIADLEGKLTYVNRALLEMGGYSGTIRRLRRAYLHR